MSHSENFARKCKIVALSVIKGNNPKLLEESTAKTQPQQDRLVSCCVCTSDEVIFGSQNKWITSLAEGDI